MTDLVTAGAKAFATVAHQHGGCCPAGVEICMEIGDCMCAESARAVLAAVEPKIRADERERAAKIAESFKCETCGRVFHESNPHTDDECSMEYASWTAPHPHEIAAAIRDGKEE